jgi:predicted MFS family arabinose efflux permease
MATEQTSRSVADTTIEGASNRWWLLALLTFVTVLNFFDRQLPFIMVEPIKREFALSDAQMGMLGGIGFSLVYALTAIPLARLADRRNRIRLLAICIAAWSAFTALAGLTRSFPQLVATRIGVAIGEAGSQPASHSLIADLFRPGERARAYSITTTGIYFGLLLGMAVGGLLLEHFLWRTVLMLAAVPGFVLALILGFLVKEPPRRGGQVEEELPNLRAAASTIWHKRSIVWLTVGAALSVFASVGPSAFGASYFIRWHGYTLAQAGLMIGLVVGLGGMIGSLLSGWLSDRLLSRDRRWVLWLPALATCVKVPFFMAVWWVHDPLLSGALLFVCFVFGGSVLPLSFTATQTVAPPRIRAFASASTQLVINIIGNVMGPIAAGLLSDQFVPLMGSASLKGAMTVMGLVFLFSGLAFFRAASFFPRDLAIVEAAEQYS